MSGGRVELGLGAGWYEAEHQAYAIPFPSARRALRAAGGAARHHHRPVGARPSASSSTSRASTTRSTASPALPKPAQRPAADHHRRRRAQAHAPPGRHLRRRVQPPVRAGRALHHPDRPGRARRATTIGRDPGHDDLLGRAGGVLRRRRGRGAAPGRGHRPPARRAAHERRRRHARRGGGHAAAVGRSGRDAASTSRCSTSSDLDHLDSWPRRSSPMSEAPPAPHGRWIVVADTAVRSVTSTASATAADRCRRSASAQRAVRRPRARSCLLASARSQPARSTDVRASSRRNSCQLARRSSSTPSRTAQPGSRSWAQSGNRHAVGQLLDVGEGAGQAVARRRRTTARPSGSRACR